MNRSELCLALAACAMTCTLPFLAPLKTHPVEKADHCPLPPQPTPLMLINETRLGRGIMLPMAGFGVMAANSDALHLSERLLAAQKYRQAINVLQPEWKANKYEPEVEVTLARAYLGAHNYTQAVPLLGDLMQKFSHYRRRHYSNRENGQESHAHRLELLDFETFDLLEPGKVATLEEDTRRALETYLLTGLDSGRLKPLQPMDRDFKLDRRYRVLVACVAAVRTPEFRNDLAVNDALYELADENANSLPPSTVSRLLFQERASDRWIKLGSLVLDAFGAERQFYLHRLKNEIALFPKKDIRVAATYLAAVNDDANNYSRVQAVESALRALPDSPRYDRYRANCLYQAGLANFKASEYESAQSQFQAAADLFEKDHRYDHAAVSHFNLGVIKSITENAGTAWKEFETARALNSEFGGRESALSTCEAVLATESQPSSKFDPFMQSELAPEALRGIYFFKKGDYDKAEQIFANYLKKRSIDADAPSLTGATNGTLGERRVHIYSQTEILDTFFQLIWCAPVTNLKSRYSECSDYELAGDRTITVDPAPSYDRVVVQLYSHILLMKGNLSGQTRLKSQFQGYFSTEAAKDELQPQSPTAHYLNSVKEQVATNWFPPDHRTLQQMTVTATLTKSGKLGRIRLGKQDAESAFGESVMESVFWGGKDLPAPPADWSGGDVQMVFNGDKTETVPSALPSGVYFPPPQKWY